MALRGGVTLTKCQKNLDPMQALFDGRERLIADKEQRDTAQCSKHGYGFRQPECSECRPRNTHPEISLELPPDVIKACRLIHQWTMKNGWADWEIEAVASRTLFLKTAAHAERLAEALKAVVDDARAMNSRQHAGLRLTSGDWSGLYQDCEVACEALAAWEGAKS